MIQGYPDRASVTPGDDLVLHVSTDARAFRVHLYRCGPRMTPMGASGWLEGRHCPDHLPHQDWGRDGVGLRGEDLPGWPAYPLPIPHAWPSGAYIAVLVEGDGDENHLDPADVRTPDARGARALFVVKGVASGNSPAILYKVPLLTYHAYNQVSQQAYDPVTQRGGWSLYTVPGPGDVPTAVPPAMSLHRPGGGTGGTPSDIWNFDPFDPTPRQTFVHWDAPFIAWLESNGYQLDYCTDIDLHDDVELELLSRYRLLVSVGHDEYWSDSMRDKVERFVRGGDNVAFFGGNTCWWRIVFDDGVTFRRVAPWSDPQGPNRPENTLTGVSFRNGGERDLDHHPIPVGYRVQHADHWAYEGTGLTDGTVFGDRAGEYLVGYECDGARFRRGGVGGAPVRPTGEDGTPEGFTILGIGDVAASGWGIGNAAATMGVYRDNGMVFTAATTDWARVLGRGQNPAVEQITANVVDRLAQR